jgi:hypothetical protein
MKRGPDATPGPIAGTIASEELPHTAFLLSSRMPSFSLASHMKYLYKYFPASPGCSNIQQKDFGNV